VAQSNPTLLPLGLKLRAQCAVLDIISRWEPRGEGLCFYYALAKGNAMEGFEKLYANDRSHSEWIFDVTFKDGGCMRNHQVAARRWADGKVIYEQFFYQPNAKPAG